jgi:hypothetical protein
VAAATRAPQRPSTQGTTVWSTGPPPAGKTGVANLVGARPATLGRAGTPPSGRRAPDREGSRRRDGGRTAVHSPRRHGGRLTGRLVRPERSRPEAARLPADGDRARRG